MIVTLITGASKGLRLCRHSSVTRNESVGAKASRIVGFCQRNGSRSPRHRRRRRSFTLRVVRMAAPAFGRAVLAFEHGVATAGRSDRSRPTSDAPR